MAKLESMVSLLIAVRDHLATVDDEALATVDDDWLVSTMRQSLTRHGWRYSDIGSDEVGVIFEDVVDAHKSKLHELRKLEQSAKHWSDLADTQDKQAEDLEAAGQYSGRHRHRARLYRRTAEAVRLRMKTGIAHCACCLLPKDKWPKSPVRR